MDEPDFRDEIQLLIKDSDHPDVVLKMVKRSLQPRGRALTAKGQTDFTERHHRMRCRRT